MQWMGNVLRRRGDAADALDYFKFALAIKRRRLGADDVDVAHTLFNTAVLLDDLEKHELSLVAYREALRIRRQVLGGDSEEVADTLFCIGTVAGVVGDREGALASYREAIEIREARLRRDDDGAAPLPPAATPRDDGPDDAALLFLSRPAVPARRDEHERLARCYEEALPLTKLVAGTDQHPDVGRHLARMGEVYRQLGDWDNAIGSFQG